MLGGLGITNLKDVAGNVPGRSGTLALAQPLAVLPGGLGAGWVLAEGWADPWFLKLWT
jgi:hypothetical protein